MQDHCIIFIEVHSSLYIMTNIFSRATKQIKYILRYKCILLLNARIQVQKSTMQELMRVFIKSIYRT